MMDANAFLLAAVALVAGLAIGWLLASRGVAALRGERDRLDERAGQAELLRRTLDEVSRERDTAQRELTAERAGSDAREAALRERHDALLAARDQLSQQFGEVGAKLLDQAQKAFIERAEQRFRQSEEKSGDHLKALLQPVNERLLRYEEGVAKVEAERRDAFGDLKGLIDSMRIGQERVSTEAARLVNSLRAAPKARGRWGEQQLRNVLETCGLSEHCDFQTEVSVDSEDGRFRPDVIVRVPGGRTLVIDAKVSLNAFQDAFGAVDEGDRALHLAAHATAMKAHVNTLGSKAYQTRFADTADYVVMFVPGEHFLSAALDQEPQLWDYAFDRRVLLATPTNLIAIARTVAAVWRQERLASDARRIADLGKELHDRLAKAAGDLRKVGGGLASAVNNYNAFVSSFESRTLVTARKFRDLNVDTGGREIEDVAPVEALARYGEGAEALPAPLLDEAAE
jgi:DNA recombination protein RmuC